MEESKDHLVDANDEPSVAPDASADGGVSEISNLGRSKPKGKKDIVVSTFNTKIREARDKTMYRDNWNYFVGDNDFKTDLLLRF